MLIPKNNHSIACIIPFFNEGKTIAKTLKIITKSSMIEQIICVNDGSIDIDKLKNQFPSVLFVSSRRNYGKVAAIKRGLAQISNSKYILLLDADLKHLNIKVIDSALSSIIKLKSLDMIILQRGRDPDIHKLFRTDIVISGQRIITTSHLQKILKSKKAKKYQLELAINEYFIENNLKTAYYPTNITDKSKTDKHGFILGNIYKLRMWRDLLTYTSLGDYIFQLFFFCRTKIASKPAFR